jgi:hypothetical protein
VGYDRCHIEYGKHSIALWKALVWRDGQQDSEGQRWCRLNQEGGLDMNEPNGRSGWGRIYTTFGSLARIEMGPLWDSGSILR